MHAFRDRRDAGRQLGPRLDCYAGNPDVVVLGLARGGIPVAYEIATRLNAPLDVVVVRKLGVPGHDELAMGAIALGGVVVIDDDTVARFRVSPRELAEIEARERTELLRREHAFRHGRSAVDLSGTIAILVDDGLATGASMIAAIDASRARSPVYVVVAVPVAPPDVCARLAMHADAVIGLVTPRQMQSVGAWYEDFTQTTDAEVRELLDFAPDPIRFPHELGHVDLTL